MVFHVKIGLVCLVGSEYEYYCLLIFLSAYKIGDNLFLYNTYLQKYVITKKKLILHFYVRKNVYDVSTVRKNIQIRTIVFLLKNVFVLRNKFMLMLMLMLMLCLFPPESFL